MWLLKRTIASEGVFLTDHGVRSIESRFSNIEAPSQWVFDSLDVKICFLMHSFKSSVTAQLSNTLQKLQKTTLSAVSIDLGHSSHDFQGRDSKTAPCSSAHFLVLLQTRTWIRSSVFRNMAEDSIRRRTACDRCHSQKIRCPRDPAHEICDRCQKAGKSCVFSPFRQKKVPEGDFGADEGSVISPASSSNGQSDVTGSSASTSNRKRQRVQTPSDREESTSKSL
jgi:hypothetical protein